MIESVLLRIYTYFHSIIAKAMLNQLDMAGEGVVLKQGVMLHNPQNISIGRKTVIGENSF